MSSHSPVRPRKPQAHPSTQVAMHRENSPSPSLRDRPRAIKAQSMPIVPAVVQMFTANNQASQQSQGQQQLQSSPTISNNSRRSPPVGIQVQRLLPTPPHPNPPNARDQSPDRRPSPPPLQHAHSQPNVNTHYPRPINRGTAPPQFLSKFQSMSDSESWQMTDELLAEIERADLQQSQGLAHPPHPYPGGYPRGESESPPKDPAVERVRATERSSPKELDSGQQQQRRQRDQQAARESPKTRDRQPTSPTAAAFAQAVQSNSPEQRISPAYHTPLSSPPETTANFTQYQQRDSPPVLRRISAPTTDSRTLQSLSSQTPPLQAINARTPDRSLPVQEEPEDDPAVASKNVNGTREMWKSNEHSLLDQHRAGSPTPSSDLNPEGNLPRYEGHGGRDSRAGHREDDDESVDSDQLRTPDDEERDTPRSPTAGLPEDPRDKYFISQGAAARAPITRARTRNGPTDQLGLRGFDPAVFDQSPQMLTMNSQDTRPYEQYPSQYTDSRKPAPKIQAPQPQQHISPPPQPQQPQPQSQPQQHYQPQPQRYHDPRAMHNARSQYYPDDYQNFLDDPASAYIQAYLSSPRPDAPIPPTPHSQTAAPSPSPLLSGMFDSGAKDLPPFSPIAPVGSPYPYPFTHVRRNQSYSGHPNRPQLPASYDPNHPAVIQEQLAKQWQVYAQNNHAGNVTDSTFSPSSTPFQGAGYNPWAFLHATRTMGGMMHDPMSMHSSPSHEPVALPTPPMLGLKKKDRFKTLRPQTITRKPPPRVESTQPRETSPEPSSSGEETAGEEHFAVVEERTWSNGATAISVPDDHDDWIDEDDDGDEDDLLELEYHPLFVSNVEKRRRKWEIGWEAVTQAFQALDRQTDATMVLLAAPSHSTKMHSLKSRSLRRQALPATTTSINELRASFRRLAAQRRSTRSHKSSLKDRFLVPSGSSADGSDGSSESREEDLKRALGAALGSLGALGGIYEQREARWIDEMRRITEDRERVELLLRQVLGEGHSLNSAYGQSP